jgi:hypothetical protein
MSALSSFIRTVNEFEERLIVRLGASQYQVRSAR